MKDDIIVLEEHHRKVACTIVSHLIGKIIGKPTRYTLSVAGESGSGKSETALAIADKLRESGIDSVVLSQDDYFYLPPKSNDIKRKQDPEWLGPDAEVNLNLLEHNLKDAIRGENDITKPLIDYSENSVEEIKISLAGVKVVIAEGTYTSLLKNIDTRIFIDRNRLETFDHRTKRNRGTEMQDPFTEQILLTEHKIIAGHKQLTDIVITKDYQVIIVSV
jgi:uridine kinase